MSSAASLPSKAVSLPSKVQPVVSCSADHLPNDVLIMVQCVQEPCYLWQAYLVDDFVATGGIGALEGLLTTQRTPSVALLEAALGVAAAVRPSTAE